MGVIVLSDPTAGTLADATQIANNNAAIKAAINGGLDNNNFAAGKIFDNTKIMQGGGITGQGLVWNGTSWVPGAGTVYRKVTNKLVSNTVAATDLLNGEITLAAGILSATGILRFSAWGTWLQNTGGAQASLRFQLILGGTTVLDTNVIAAVNASNAQVLPWRVSGWIIASNSTGQQFAQLDVDAIEVASASAAATYATGSGLYRTDAAVGGYHFLRGQGWNQTTVDMTASRTFVLNVIQPVANANMQTTLYGATVEIQ